MLQAARQSTRSVASFACVFVALASSLARTSVAQEEDEAAAAKFDAIASADTMEMVPMRDGVGLQTDVYLPKGEEGPFPVIFVKTPYNFNKIEGGQLEWAIEAIERGYAFVVQNERGRYYSEGEWEILGRPRTDGYDSLDWIAESDTYTYDPMNPVPALGGGVCCNRDAALGGSYDQRAIEARADVLVYTSEPLERDTQVTGSIRATLYVSSDVKDTDFTVKLVDVHPDGTAYNVDDTILRARYREGYDKEFS